MSERWEIGDLAVCVDARDHPFFGPSPLVEGRVYTVIGLAKPGRCVLFDRDHAAPGLLIDGATAPFADQGFAPERFRKVQHDKPEACETAFTVLLNRSKRKVGA